MDDLTKIYDDLFEHAMHLLNDHQKPPEMVAGTMMAIAQRIYRTQMNEELAELLKSNRKIINITPEDVIDIEATDESKQLPQPLTPIKTKSDQDSTS